VHRREKKFGNILAGKTINKKREKTEGDGEIYKNAKSKKGENLRFMEPKYR
jgi:hypothetical protein